MVTRKRVSKFKFESSSTPGNPTGVSAEELLTNEWVSATKTRNYMNQDPILDWFELYGDENAFPRDTGIPKYDACLLGQKYDQNAIVYSGEDAIPSLILLR